MHARVIEVSKQTRPPGFCSERSRFVSCLSKRAATAGASWSGRNAICRDLPIMRAVVSVGNVDAEMIPYFV